MRVGSVVKKTNSYWFGELQEIDDTVGKLFVIIEADRVQGMYEYGIAELDNFENQSWWWNDNQLEFVRDGFDKEYRDFLNFDEETGEDE